MAVHYDGYSVAALPSFALRYTEGQEHVDFFFDPGGGPKDVLIFSSPTGRSEGMLTADIARGLERVIAHLKSVGYNVRVEDQ